MREIPDDLFEKLDVNPVYTNRFKVKTDYVYKDITVPEGYTTNGADIPRVFWSIVPPFKPKYLPAIVVHDYLCDRGEYLKADDYFEEILLSIENTFITRGMVSLVRLYHELKYGVTPEDRESKLDVIKTLNGKYSSRELEKIHREETEQIREQLGK